MKTIIDAMREIHAHKFPGQTIFAFIGGSQLHGAKLEGNDDLDIYGVFIEEQRYALGLDKFEHYVTSTSDNTRRNGPDDVDIAMYSLRKWAGLAAKGNPTALHFLFVPGHYYANPLWLELLAHRELFLCKKHANHFKGFANTQLARLFGSAGQGKHGQRPELEEQYGYDVKAGMHVIRLLNEGIELMRDHRITLPRPEKELLIEVRTGKWSQDKLCNEAYKLFVAIDNATEESTLPEQIDREALSQLITKTYSKFYGIGESNVSNESTLSRVRRFRASESTV